ncbi:MAG: hypothetical protein CML22_06725 [Rheinheimera sp.]|nr:hypothetical protein [Rheinheimera sp.]MBM33976.1 hypothetical protein [Rheinheimera sp.]|tara:strand:+ start:1023 stop:1334 length:312 start_codon:yes stop_codon:yes gene_type:complete
MSNEFTNSIYIKALIGLVIIKVGILFSTAVLFALGFITNSATNYLGFELKNFTQDVFSNTLLTGLVSLTAIGMAAMLIYLIFEIAEGLGEIALKHYGKFMGKV